MKRRKILNLRKAISFLLVFLLFFSQNSMMVFADILNTKSVVKVSNNTSNEKDNSNEKESTKETIKNDDSTIENNLRNNSIELGKIQDGSYTLTEEGIYPFTGDWGKECTLKSQDSNGEKRISTYDSKGSHYYKQLNEKQKLAYDLYYELLKDTDQDNFVNVSKHNLTVSDFYGVLSPVIHENPDIFWGFNLIVNVERGIVKEIKYSTPFEQADLDKMKRQFKKGVTTALNEIHSKLDDNSTDAGIVTNDFYIVKEIHDYLVANNHYGTPGCPEETHPDPKGHLTCKGLFIEHSAYGALVKTNNYGVVCEGFASAFVLLCKFFNIDAIYDAGYKNNERNGLHAWNYVKMEDDNWYLVDLTYDNNYFQRNGIVYDLFLAGIDNPDFEYKHSKYLGYNFDETYTGPEYNIPTISKNSYVKFEVVYPKEGNNRDVFANFSDLVDNLQKSGLSGNHKIMLKDNYNLTQEELKKLIYYKVNCKQNFTIKSDDFEKSDKCYTLSSDIDKVYFPMSVCLQNIIYKIDSTYVGGDNIIVEKGVSNGDSKCSLYLLGKDDSTQVSEVCVKSGYWENVVGTYSSKPNSADNINHRDLNITLEGAMIENMTVSQGIIIKGNINVKILKGSSIRKFKYGDGIDIDNGKSLNIDISGATVKEFEKNTDPISANTNITIKDGAIVQKLVGPTVRNRSYKCTTTMDIISGRVDNIIGSDNVSNINPDNNVVININSNATSTNKSIKSIKGSSYQSVSATINIKDNVDVGSITDFEDLVIENGKKLNVLDELDYNKTNNNKIGMVTFNGNSTLKLPNSISKVGSLSSIGQLNKLIISKENKFLQINERQKNQETPITIQYSEGLHPNDKDELVRYTHIEDINLNNFINGVSTRFDLDRDDTTGSIRLVLSGYPIKIKFKNGELYSSSSLCEALNHIERQGNENAKEVTFYINEDYEMSKDDLAKLKSYSSGVAGQKFVFTSENESAVLSTSNDVTFPTGKKLGSIEFKNITLDFGNRSIFAAGNNLIISESVIMPSRTNVNIYGGLFGKEVTNSSLTLEGGVFKNVYGGGSVVNGSTLIDTNISIDKKVVVKGNVYGGAEYDKTGSSKISGKTTINLLGGKVLGDVIGGGKNDKSPVYNKIVINYSGTKLTSIYGLTNKLAPTTSNNISSIKINIKKDAELETIAGFSNIKVDAGVTLDVSEILKYDAGISSNSQGKVTLNTGSRLCIPDTTDEEHRKIGSLETNGLSNLNIYKDKYLVLNDKTNAVTGKSIKISYHNNETPNLGDKLVKFSNKLLASNESFTTDYHFDIWAETETGYLYLSKKTYKVSLYKDANTLYKTYNVPENEDFTFEEPIKEKGKDFIRWRDKDQDSVYYSAGRKIQVNRDISVEAEYEDVEEFEVTLKINEMHYKTEYVKPGGTYTFEQAPPIPEKYFIGWEDESGPSNNTYGLSRLIIDNINYMQPGTTITVNRDLVFDAEYRDEVKYDVDYGDENEKVHKVYYDGGTIKVPTLPPLNIKIPFGKIFGGFRVIFNGVGNIVGGIVNSIFRPGQSVTIKPGIHIEADWVDELHVNLYDEDGDFDKTDKVGKGLEYIVPKAPDIEYKEFLYWKNIKHPNDIYRENEKITVDTNLDLKPVYKNNKIISLSLDSNEPKYFANLSLALKQAENSAAKVVTFELLEDYALTDPDIEKLMNFSGNGKKLIIRGCNNNKKLRVEKSIKLSTDTKFENIVLNYVSNNNQAIYARGHELEMGNGITMEGIGAPILVGGDNETNVEQSNIIVRSGTYKAIYGGGYSEYSVVNGNTTIELLGGKVLGDIYGGSQSTDLNNNLIKRGTTTIKLCKGEVGGVVSGTSKFLGYGNSNDVNIYLQGTELKQGEVYGGYLDPEQVSHNIGVTTITVGDNYNLNKLLGFTKLIINQGVSLAVNQVLSHIGGVQLTQSSGEVCLNGNSKLIVPSTTYEEYRQVGWINSKGSNNEIRVNKSQYLTLTSTKEDEIDNNRVILDFKNPDTSKEISVLLKYPENKGKAKSKSFKKGSNIQRELVLKGDKEKGVIYSDERNLIRITDPKEKSRGFKTIKDAIESIKSDSPKGDYKINLLENYTLKGTDITALKDLSRNDINFVITGLLNENTNSKAELKVSSNIMLSTDTKFENIVFDCGESNNYGIYARGHKLEMGNGITIKETGAPILLGGENKKDVNKSEIIVESGTYSNIYGGGYEEYSGVHGNISIKLLGGKVLGDIYAGSQNTGLISCGKTDIKLSGGTVGGVVSGASRLLGLENSNDVDIYLQGTKLNKVYGGYYEDIENPDDTGDTTIKVEKGYTLNNLVGFTKLDIKEGVCLEVKKVLNHKGGIRVTDSSGEVCLNGNSTLIAPASHNPSEIQIGWLNSKEENNKIFVYKDMYLSLTSKKEDTISDPIELGLKNNLDGTSIEGITKKSILLKYENNKHKAKNNINSFKKGIYILDEVIIEPDEKDGSIYMEEGPF